MDPATILAAANGAAGLLNILVPEIAKLVQSGQISPADQTALMARVTAIGADPASFAGAEWQPS